MLARASKLKRKGAVTANSLGNPWTNVQIGVKAGCAGAGKARGLSHGAYCDRHNGMQLDSARAFADTRIILVSVGEPTVTLWPCRNLGNRAAFLSSQIKYLPTQRQFRLPSYTFQQFHVSHRANMALTEPFSAFGL